MTLDTDHARLAPCVPRLSGYLRSLLDRAGERAVELYSDEVGPEHVLVACMRDEDCAAHGVAVHAFADPETIEFELTALCPGIMVVGSDAALPFSPRAVTALEAARASTKEQVTTEALFQACTSALDEAGRAALQEAGHTPGDLSPGAGSAVPDSTESLFRRFEDGAKRALSMAGKAAGRARSEHITPGHLAIACLQADDSLGDRVGVSLARARAALRPHLGDASRPAGRRVPPNDDLVEVLESLPEDADSLTFLTAARNTGSQELQALLERHKVTSSLLERARGAFRDPAPGSLD